MSMIRFDCPHCGKQLRAPENYAGRRVQCTSPVCRHIFVMPAPQTLEPIFEPEEPEELEPSAGRRMLRVALISAGIVLFCLGSAWGVHWFTGRPSSEHVAAFEGFFRTGNELYDLQLETKTEEQARAAEARIMALADEHLGFRKKIEEARGRKRRNLIDRYQPRIEELARKVVEMVESGRPIMVFIALGPENGGNLISLAVGADNFQKEGPKEFRILRMGWYTGVRTGQTGPPASAPPGPPAAPPQPSPTQSPEDLLRSVAGTWEAPDITFTISPGGEVKSVLTIPHDSKVTVCFNTSTIAVKDGRMKLSFTVPVGTDSLDFDFTLTPGQDGRDLTIRETKNRITPNPITLKKRDPKSALEAPVAKAAPPPEPKLEGEWALDLKHRVFTAGEKDYLAVSREHTLKIRGDMIEIKGHVPGAMVGRRYKLELDPKASPKKYKIVGAESDDVEEGIYSLEGDKLLMRATKIGSRFPDFTFSGISLNESGGSDPIPAGFELRRGDKGFAVLEFRRAAKK